jgi:hypothetical protein
LKNRWTALKTDQIDTIYAYVDEMAASLQQAQQNNFKRWPILGAYVWPNAEVAGSYDAEVAYLEDWLAQRIAWMDAQLQ